MARGGRAEMHHRSTTKTRDAEQDRSPSLTFARLAVHAATQKTVGLHLLRVCCGCGHRSRTCASAPVQKLKKCGTVQKRTAMRVDASL